MSRKKTILLAACALCLAVMSTSLLRSSLQAAPESPAADFSIPWWTVDNGGGTSQGGSFVLSGTIGQPDAASISGGIYTLRGGFWSGLLDFLTYLPIIRR